MKFKNIFDVFSRRQSMSKVVMTQVSVTLRNKVLMLCRDVFRGIRNYGMIPPYSPAEMFNGFYKEIHYALTYILGRPMLVPEDPSETLSEDVIKYLTCCQDDQFLDFIELIFKTQIVSLVCADVNSLVDEINELLRSENVGFELTRMIMKPIVTDRSDLSSEPFTYAVPGQQYHLADVLAYPQIIMKENLVVHTEILQPVLNLLSDVRYANANKEYMEALDDYRKGEYRDCLTMCCSAYESVMKIICANKNWGCKTTDTSKQLIPVMISNIPLEPYFDSFLSTVPTLRNKLSKSHGAGIETKNVPNYLARYALNACASTIIFLIDATK